MPDSESLKAAYSRAGEDFFSFRLMGMFRELKTPEDVALHNVIQREVMTMLGDKPNNFYRLLAHRLLSDDTLGRKALRAIVADSILKATKG